MWQSSIWYILIRDILPHLWFALVALVLCRRIWFSFSYLVWGLRSSISLSLLVDICFVFEEVLVGDFQRRYFIWAGCSNPAFSRELVILLGCLFCLVFSDNETSALKKLLLWWRSCTHRARKKGFMCTKLRARKSIKTPLSSTPMLFKASSNFCAWKQIIF